eukprot:TRINITY_DN8619_c0_g1_i1.p1 TRINITY_DN8619_c0_g1~~TRINITY_DN8619_c0_g1_i1.p1  ORF type:complete len:217 (+),score=11.76 TRINITY_DN8619_c0_g1_i1:322-972(+)
MLQIYLRIRPESHRDGSIQLFLRIDQPSHRLLPWLLTLDVWRTVSLGFRPIAAGELQLIHSWRQQHPNMREIEAALNIARPSLTAAELLPDVLYVLGNAATNMQAQDHLETFFNAPWHSYKAVYFNFQVDEPHERNMEFQLPLIHAGDLCLDNPVKLNSNSSIERCSYELQLVNRQRDKFDLENCCYEIAVQSFEAGDGEDCPYFPLHQANAAYLR